MSEQLLEQRLTALADRAEIENLLGIYCRAIDRLDMELLKTVYHPDAIDDHGAIVANAHDFAEQIIPILRQVCIYSQHAITHAVIDVDGDRAISEATYTGFHTIAADAEAIGNFFGPAYLAAQREAGTLQQTHEYICGGRYLDQLEKRAGVWRIAHRKMTNEWSISRASSVVTEGMAGAFASPGSRDGTDPVYALQQWLQRPGT